MIRVMVLPRRHRAGPRRYRNVFDGAILTGLLIAWRCGHAHAEKLEAQQCADHEARWRGIPQWQDVNETVVVNGYLEGGGRG